MRGTLSGGLWGLMIGGAGLVVGSQLGQLPSRDIADMAETPTAVSEAVEPDVMPTDTVVEAPEPEPSAETAAPVADEVTQAEAAPTQDPAPSAQADNVAIPAQPTPSAEPPEATALVLEAPESPDIAENPDPIVLSEDDGTIPPQPPVELPQINVASADEPDNGGLIAAEDATQPAAVSSVEEPVKIAPAPALTELTDDNPPAPEITTAVAPQSEPAQTAEAEAAEAETAEPVTEEATPGPVAEAAPTLPEQDQALQIAALPDVQDDQPPAAIVQPVEEVEVTSPKTPELTEQAESEPATGIEEDLLTTTADPIVADPTPAEQTATPRVRVNRPGAEPSPPAGQSAEVVTDEAAADDLPALQRFATPFEVVDDGPMMSVVLLDNEALEGSVEKVAALGFPVTVVLDPLSAEAADRMATYRAKGIEVGLTASLPGGATPIDVEVTFEAAFRVVPEATILFSDGLDGVQGSRAIINQVVQVLAAEGRGLVAVQKGLGNALRVAEQAQVPAAEVARDLDGDGLDERAVNRALDQAAFRARQAGDVVLLARMSDKMLDILTDWSIGNSDEQVKLAPVTAILMKQEQ